MKRINMGIIGVGHWGPNLVRNFHEHPSVSVTTICDASAERLKLFREKYPDVRLSDDWKAVVSDTAVEAVVIATPTCTHYDIARQALENGKHVFVEKPLALTTKEAAALTALAKERRLKLMVGHVFLFNPAVRFIRETLDRGGIGTPLYFCFTRTNLGPVRGDVNAFWDLAPHDISMLLYLIGVPPKLVSAQGASYINPPLEDVVFANLRFPGDIFANVHVSWLDPKKDRNITIVGSEKMLVFDDLQPKTPIRIFNKSVGHSKSEGVINDTITLFRKSIFEGECVTPEVPFSEPLRNECGAFVDWIEGKIEMPSDGAFGTAVVQVLEAVSESMRRDGAPVTLG